MISDRSQGRQDWVGRQPEYHENRVAMKGSIVSVGCTRVMLLVSFWGMIGTE